jgi:sensor histidine kinase YesM
VAAGFLLSFGISRWYSIDLFGSFLLVVPAMFVYGEMNLSAWFVARTFPLGKKNIRQILAVLLASMIVISMLWTALCWGWLLILEQLFSVILFPQKIISQLFIIGGIGSQLYLISLGVSYLMSTVEVSRNAERNAFEAQLLAQSAELKALRMQINPHFLFNSLNSINALISQGPEQAREMTTFLADFFRKSLQYGSKETITLGEEISLLNDYLAIEKIRFGRRIEIEQEIDPSALSVPVPPLILQPLMENAIKHGISGTVDGGIIRLEVKKKQNRVFITLENPFDREMPPKKGTGLGLQIIRKRLETIFGSDGDIQVYRDENIFRTVLFFPIRSL